MEVTTLACLRSRPNPANYDWSPPPQSAAPKQSFDQPDAESTRLGILASAHAVRNIPKLLAGQVKAGQVLRWMCGMLPLVSNVHFVNNAVRSQIDSLFLRGVLAAMRLRNHNPANAEFITPKFNSVE